MKTGVFTRGIAMAAVLTAAVACSSGPPKIHDLTMGKDKDVTKATTAFDAKDNLYAVANIDSPPNNGKVVGKFVIVDVPGQPAGPVASLETPLTLTGGMNKANFHYTPPASGWPNGKYQLQVVLFDSTGAQKDQKNTDFTVTGGAPAAASAPATDTSATDTTATDTAAPTDTASTDTKQ